MNSDGSSWLSTWLVQKSWLGRESPRRHTSLCGVKAFPERLMEQEERNFLDVSCRIPWTGDKTEKAATALVLAACLQRHCDRLLHTPTAMPPLLRPQQTLFVPLERGVGKAQENGLISHMLTVGLCRLDAVRGILVFTQGQYQMQMLHECRLGRFWRFVFTR